MKAQDLKSVIFADVDDLIITRGTLRNSTNKMAYLIVLNEVNELGKLKYIIGPKVEHLEKGLFLGNRVRKGSLVDLPNISVETYIH